MNTKEFIRELSDRLGVSQKEANNLLKATTGILEEAFSEGKGISIQKLGNFSIRKTEPRKIFSPKIQKHVLTPPKNTLEFHPANPLKEKMKTIRTP